MLTIALKSFGIFPGADNLNPMFSGDGHNIYFLSNSDGYRNLFKFDTKTN
jgi:Tol biopolymer transport system component